LSPLCVKRQKHDEYLTAPLNMHISQNNERDKYVKTNFCHNKQFCLNYLKQ